MRDLAGVLLIETMLNLGVACPEATAAAWREGRRLINGLGK